MIVKPKCVYCLRPATPEQVKRIAPDPRDDPKRNVELRKGNK